MLDCRASSEAECVPCIAARFNALAPGDRIEVRLASYGQGVRGFMLEGGLRHTAAMQPDGTWRLVIGRELSPVLGSARGVHHLLADGDAIWTCQRGTLAARIDGAARRPAVVAAILDTGSHLAHDAGTHRVFIADSAANAILALDADDLRVVDRWAAPGGPQLPLVNPDGIVCVTGARSGSLTIARPQDGGYRAETIAVGPYPHDPLVASDGEHLFVPCMGARELVKVRLGDGRIVGRCAVGDGPGHLKAHPDGKRIYAANSWDGTVTCLTNDGALVASAESGGWAHAIDITPDGRTVWVANFLDDTVAVFDADTLERVALLETEAYPHGLDISPDGRRAVVGGFAARHLRVFDVARRDLLARVEVGRGSAHTAFLAGTATAFTCCSVDDHLACIDLETGTLTGTIALGSAAAGSATPG